MRRIEHTISFISMAVALVVPLAMSGCDSATQGTAEKISPANTEAQSGDQEKDKKSTGVQDTDTKSAEDQDDTKSSDKKAIPEEAISDDGKHIDLAKLITLEKSKAHGIDVSHHQGEIDWQKVKDVGVHFVYVKATEGDDWTDPSFLNYWQGLKEIGIPAGAYHMFRPEDTAEEQAANFIAALKQVGYSKDDLPPVLDIERVHTIKDVPHVELHERSVAFLKLVEKETGHTPVIYTSPKFWQHFLSDIHELTTYPLWVAEYDMDAMKPATTAGWKSWHFWQFSQYGLLDGVEKPVDLNRYYSTPEALEKFLSTVK